MAELFTSFDEAWSFFLRRTAPLNEFFADFDEDEGTVSEGWVVEPPAHVKLAAGRIQDAMSHLSALVPVPDHFLHIWVGLRDRIGRTWEGWTDIDRLSVTYGRVNGFHSAVVVEVDGPIRRLVAGTPNDVPVFLPHMTIAVTRGGVRGRRPPRAASSATRNPARRAGRTRGETRSLSSSADDALSAMDGGAARPAPLAR